MKIKNQETQIRESLQRTSEIRQAILEILPKEESEGLSARTVTGRLQDDGYQVSYETTQQNLFFMYVQKVIDRGKEREGREHQYYLIKE